MSTPCHAYLGRRDTTADRIERALANGPLSARELAAQLQVTVSTIRNAIPYTDAVAVGFQRIRTGRPWVRYALPGWKPAPGEPETIGFNHVEAVEKAIAERPRTVTELSQLLALSETLIRSVLPHTRAVVIACFQPSSPRRGRPPVLYGIHAEAPPGDVRNDQAALA